MKRAKPVKDLNDLRYKMAEKMAEFENGEITPSEAKVYVGFGGVILNSFKVEIFNNQAAGVNTAIDFLIDVDKTYSKKPALKASNGA